MLALGATAALAGACGRRPPVPSTPSAAPWQARLQDGTDAAPREIGFLGDSIAFGGGQWGSSAPKWENSFVGRLRSLLTPSLGDGGSGWIFLNQALWPETGSNAGWDPRLVVRGPVTKPARGLFRRTCARLPPRSGSAAEASVELSAPGDTFSLLTLADEGSAGRVAVSVDGGGPVHVGPGRQTSTTAARVRPGTHPGHIVTDVALGSGGQHRCRVWAEDGPVDLVAVRAGTGAGRVVITSAAVSGESLATFCGPGADDEQGGTSGPAFLDSLRFDLLVVELGANDYNAGRPLGPTRELLLRVVDRQRSTGGDVVLMFPPISTPRLYPGAGAPTYEEYAAMLAGAAADRGVPFLDLTHLWGATFDEGQALRPARYADGIHPSDAGAADIANRCAHFLGLAV